MTTHKRSKKHPFLLAVSLLSVYSTMAKESFFLKKKANTKHCLQFMDEFNYSWKRISFSDLGC